jgi:transcriptional regulator with GAF, ATPase, and Fis domain
MQRIAILYDASQAVLSTFDLDEVLNQVLAIVHDYFHLQNGSIMLLDEASQALTIRAYFGEGNLPARASPEPRPKRGVRFIRRM